MKSHIMFMEWETQYYFDVISPQIGLSTQHSAS